MKKAILSILFVFGFIICAYWHWMAMAVYYILLLAIVIIVVDFDDWREKKRNKAILLALETHILDMFLDNPNATYDLENLEDLFLDSALYDDDGFYYVVESEESEIEGYLIAYAINDLIKHGIVNIVFTDRGFQIGYRRKER